MATILETNPPELYGSGLFVEHNGEYFIISYSPLSDETLIFNADENKVMNNYRDIWSRRGRKLDEALKFLEEK